MNAVIFIDDAWSWDPGDDTKVRISGTVMCPGASAIGPIGWSVTVGTGLSSLTLNNAIKDAAVAAVANYGLTISALDAKMLIGAPVAL